MGTIELFWRLLKGLVESGMRYVEGMMESTQLVQSWRLQVSPFNSSHVHKGKWTQGSRIQAFLWSFFPLTTPFIEMLLWGLCPSWLISLSFLITSTCSLIAFTCNFPFPWVLSLILTSSVLREIDRAHASKPACGSGKKVKAALWNCTWHSQLW